MSSDRSVEGASSVANIPIIDITVNGQGQEDDALDDLLEEQLLIRRIKAVEDARKSLDVNTTVNNKHSNYENGNTSIDDNDDILELLGEPMVVEKISRYDELCKLQKQLSDVEEMLKHNKLMQSMLIKLESKLTESIQENEIEQCDLEKKENDLKNDRGKEAAVGEQNTSRFWYYRFGMPYFKDGHKEQCPPNSDYETMVRNKELILTDLPVYRIWKYKYKLLLEEAIRKDLVEEQSYSFVRKEMDLREELKQCESFEVERKKSLRTELINVRNQIAAINEKTLSELYGKCDPNREFDWMRISFDNLSSHHSPIECFKMWENYVCPKFNKGVWSSEEDESLCSLAEKYNRQDWDLIAKELNTSRSPYQCFINFQTRLNKSLKRNGKWTPDEDLKLASLVSQCKVGNNIPWKKVSYYFDGRSVTQLYARWMLSLNPDLKKGRFSRHEDRVVMSLLKKFGKDFKQVSKIMGYRTTTQIRQRFARAYPDKLTQIGRWTLQEDELLLNLVEKYGFGRWSKISNHFITRNRTQVRQRFKLLQKIQEKEDLDLTKIRRVPQKDGWYIQNRKRRRSWVDQEEEEPAAKESKEKPLEDLVKEDSLRESELIKQMHMSLVQLRPGRKRLLSRCTEDNYLINYFKECFINQKLFQKTRSTRFDVEYAAKAMENVCSFLGVKLSSAMELKGLKASIRRVVKVMRDKYIPSNDHAEIPSSSHAPNLNEPSCSSRPDFELFIDCQPVDPKSTTVTLENYMLYEVESENKCSLSELKHGAYLMPDGKESCAKDSKDLLPYVLPPNVITLIGLRSTLLIQKKLISGLQDADANEPTFQSKFTNLLPRVRCDSDSEASELESNAPSTSSITNEKRLTSEEAISLWKERLVTLFAWPIALSNQMPVNSLGALFTVPKNPMLQDPSSKDDSDEPADEENSQEVAQPVGSPASSLSTQKKRKLKRLLNCMKDVNLKIEATKNKKRRLTQSLRRQSTRKRTQRVPYQER